MPPDDPVPLPDPTPEEMARMEAEITAAEADAEEARDRKWELVGSRRITAYADFLAAVADLLCPRDGDGVTRQRARLSQLTRGELDLALRAIFCDVQRMARFTGPRVTGFHGEGE